MSTRMYVSVAGVEHAERGRTFDKKDGQEGGEAE